MTKKIYLILLILCGISSHGIITTFAEGDFKESSHLLLRNKRLVSSQPHRVEKISIDKAPYVVQILKNNFYACVGNIILPQVILTAAHCFNNPETYSIRSGSSLANHGTFHNITKRLIHPQYQIPNINDLVLLNIFPHIDIVHSPNRVIIIHRGHIPPRTVGRVSSWGCIGENSNGLILPKQLRSITTPITSQEECHHIHHGDPHHPVAITDKNICTHDIVTGNKCHLGDSGAPLVVYNGLAGIMSWNRPLGGPDVFINLSYPEYRNWIFMNLPPNPYYPKIQHNAHNAHNSHTSIIGHFKNMFWGTN